MCPSGVDESLALGLTKYYGATETPPVKIFIWGQNLIKEKIKINIKLQNDYFIQDKITNEEIHPS